MLLFKLFCYFLLRWSFKKRVKHFLSTISFSGNCLPVPRTGRRTRRGWASPTPTVFPSDQGRGYILPSIQMISSNTSPINCYLAHWSFFKSLTSSPATTTMASPPLPKPTPWLPMFGTTMYSWFSFYFSMLVKRFGKVGIIILKPWLTVRLIIL